MPCHKIRTSGVSPSKTSTSLVIDAGVDTVISLVLDGGIVTGIYVVRNPEKLRRVAAG